MPNSDEIIVKTVNLFVSSNDRSRCTNNPDNGKINIPFKNLPFEAKTNQSLRMSVMQFTSANQFDRCIAPNNQFQIYIGSAVKTTVELQNAGCANPTVVSGGTLIGAQLLMPRYDNYADVALDFINAIAIALEPIYPSTQSGSTGFEYQITRLSGGGRVVPGNGSYLFNSIAPGVAPAQPYTWGTIGNFSQNGEKVMTVTMTITNRSGSDFPDQNYNQTIDNQAFGIFFSDTNDTYLQVGGKPSKMSEFPGFLIAAANCARGAVIDGSTGDDLPANSIGMGGVYGSIVAVGPTLTIQISQRCPMVLTTEPLLYLRTNIVSSNHATSNMNEVQGTIDPQDTEPTNILASFAINNDVIFFQESAGDSPAFFMDASSKSINNLELFLTDRHGNTDFRLFPNHSTTSYTSNISFTCMLRLQIIEKPVIESNSNIQEQQGMPPARFHSRPLVNPGLGNSMLDTAKNRLASRRL